MTLKPLSEIIQEVLSGMDCADGAATPKRGNERLGERSNALDPKFAAATGVLTGKEERSGVRLAWVNTALRQSTRRAVLSLNVVEGGKR